MCWPPRPAVAGQQPLHEGHRPAQPGRRHAHPDAVRRVARCARPGQVPADRAADRREDPGRRVRGLPGHRQLRQRGRPDDPVLGRPRRRRSRRHRGANAVPAIRAQVTSVQHAAGANDSGVAGEAPATYDISSISDSDLKHIIPIAILVIGLLLAIVLRSLVAPLYLIASVGRLLPGRARPFRAAVHQARRLRRAGVLPAVPDVHLPAGSRRGLQHPGDDQDQGGSAASCRSARRWPWRSASPGRR